MTSKVERSSREFREPEFDAGILKEICRRISDGVYMGSLVIDRSDHR